MFWFVVSSFLPSDVCLYSGECPTGYAVNTSRKGYLVTSGGQNLNKHYTLVASHKIDNSVQEPLSGKCASLQGNILLPQVTLNC